MALEHVVDAVDVETALICSDEEEAKKLATQIMYSFGLKNPHVIFLELNGRVARVRIRAYVHRAGDQTTWLKV